MSSYSFINDNLNDNLIIPQASINDDYIENFEDNDSYSTNIQQLNLESQTDPRVIYNPNIELMDTEADSKNYTKELNDELDNILSELKENNDYTVRTIAETYDEPEMEKIKEIKDVTVDLLKLKRDIYFEDILHLKYYNKFNKNVTINKRIIVLLLLILKLLLSCIIICGCFVSKKYQPIYIIILMVILIINELNDDKCFISNCINNIIKDDNIDASIIKRSSYKNILIILIVITGIGYLYPQVSLHNIIKNMINDTKEVKNLDSKIFPDIKPNQFKIEMTNQDALKNLSILDIEYS